VPPSRRGRRSLSLDGTSDEDDVELLRHRQAKRRRAAPSHLDPEQTPVRPPESIPTPLPSKKKRKLPKPEQEDSEETPSREGSLSRALRERAKKNAEFMEALGLTGRGIVNEAAAATGDSAKLASRKKQQRKEEKKRRQ